MCTPVLDDRDKRQCIFSADIDGEGCRLATGGMDGVIRIWRLASLFDKQAGPVLLSSMNRHGGSVLSVRWASNGLLASSSDDCSVLVWQLDR
jgi:WD40 repeat protein